MSVGTYQIGLKTLLSLVREGDPIQWHRSKLDVGLFKGDEVNLFQFIDHHISSYSQLPTIETLHEANPTLIAINCNEPAKFYLDTLSTRYRYDLINTANVESQKLLADDKNNVDAAEAILEKTLEDIKARKYATRLIDFGKEAKNLLLSNYHKDKASDTRAKFFWPYMDNMSDGAIGGDVVSFVGRPASGKSWMIFRTATLNWRISKARCIVVSMEMNVLSVSQRIATMYSETNLTQLKKKAYASPTYKKFVDSLTAIESEEGALYIVDGNLAADVEDIYMLANQLNVDCVYIDGAYLVRTKNTRLNRFERVTEVAEKIKTYSGSIEIPSFSSWQFNRDATKKKAGQKGDTAGLENIGMSDSIGQLSSIVISLAQEESAETLENRVLTLLKGRDGEVGAFSINWDFQTMNFDQVDTSIIKQMEHL